MRRVLRERGRLDGKPAWFVLIGVVGFLIDAGVLHVLVFVFEINVFGARAVSFLTAASTTWAANRVLTFSAPSAAWAALWTEWLRYLAASLIGGAVNYGAFALAIAFSPLVRQNPVIGVAIGSAAGMCVNYALYAAVVFRSRD